MAYALDQEERGLYFLIRFQGDFSIKALSQLRGAVQAALETGHIYVAFDLSKTSFMDSSGTGLLSNLNQKLVARGGSVFLIGVGAPLRTAMNPSGIFQTIPSVATIEDADLQIG